MTVSLCLITCRDYRNLCFISHNLRFTQQYISSSINTSVPLFSQSESIISSLGKCHDLFPGKGQYSMTSDFGLLTRLLVCWKLNWYVIQRMWCKVYSANTLLKEDNTHSMQFHSFIDVLLPIERPMWRTRTRGILVRFCFTTEPKSLIHLWVPYGHITLFKHCLNITEQHCLNISFWLKISTDIYNLISTIVQHWQLMW